MVFTEKGRVVIKFLHQNKGYSTRHLVNWKIGGLNKLLANIDDTGSTARHRSAKNRTQLIRTSTALHTARVIVSVSLLRKILNACQN